MKEKSGKSPAKHYKILYLKEKPPGYSPYRLVEEEGKEVPEVNEFLDAEATRGLSLQTLDIYIDADGDGHCDELDDACPDDPTGWTDADGDGHCDEIDDKCPEDPNQWTDADWDGYCDEIDDDCPNDPDWWNDTNGDGVCDGMDDCDGDGILDGEEIIYGEDCAISDPCQNITEPYPTT